MFATTLNVRNVNEALARGLKLLASDAAEVEETRNGPVRSWAGPVLTATLQPMERVLFSPLRDANPFFHLFESLWMLAGRNDLSWLTQFNRQMEAYSDDGGVTQPAAYGHRWRKFFGYDQLDLVVAELKERPNSRRAVLGMWNPGGDRNNSLLIGVSDLVSAFNGSKDVPCNTHCYFRITRGGALDMAVCCRSNDALWGAHGANVVHFSVMMEYVAARLGLSMGTMYQFSFNYHMYPDVFKHKALVMAEDAAVYDYYKDGVVTTTPIFDPATMDIFERDLQTFMDFAAPDHNRTVDPRIQHEFLRGVALPMLRAWDYHKMKDYPAAREAAYEITNGDWHKASVQWIRRREVAYSSEKVDA